MNKIDWLGIFRHMSPALQIEVIFLIFMIVIVLPIVGYLTLERTRHRKQIAKRGIQSIGGKCPKCSGKLKVIDLFAGRANLTNYKIGAARCTLCRHLEIFSEEY